MYESEAECWTGICSKTFYSLFISLNQDFNENVSTGRLVLRKKLNTCSTSANQMPGTENTQDFLKYIILYNVKSNNKKICLLHDSEKIRNISEVFWKTDFIFR